MVWTSSFDSIGLGCVHVPCYPPNSFVFSKIVQTVFDDSLVFLGANQTKCPTEVLSGVFLFKGTRHYRLSEEFRI